MPIGSYGVGRIVAGRNGENFTYSSPSGNEVLSGRGVFYDSTGTDRETDMGDDHVRVEVAELKLRTGFEMPIGTTVTRASDSRTYKVNQRRQASAIWTYWLKGDE